MNQIEEKESFIKIHLKKAIHEGNKKIIDAIEIGNKKLKNS